MTSHTENFLDGYLPYVLRRADQALSAAFYGLLTERGVARSEWRVLAVLQELGELSILDLATASLSPQPTVTHAVRRLEARGLVKRVLGTDDKRQRFVSVTRTGAELTSELIEQAKRLESQALASTEDLVELVERLNELTEIVQANVTEQRDGNLITVDEDLAS